MADEDIHDELEDLELTDEVTDDIAGGSALPPRVSAPSQTGVIGGGVPSSKSRVSISGSPAPQAAPAAPSAPPIRPMPRRPGGFGI